MATQVLRARRPLQRKNCSSTSYALSKRPTEPKTLIFMKTLSLRQVAAAGECPTGTGSLFQQSFGRKRHKKKKSSTNTTNRSSRNLRLHVAQVFSCCCKGKHFSLNNKLFSNYFHTTCNTVSRSPVFCGTSGKQINLLFSRFARKFRA